MTRFRDLALREMRTMTLLEGNAGVPAGQYGLMELYCNEHGCDCRRVHIQVITPPPDSAVIANISLGWEDAELYQMPGGKELDLKGPFLDPLNYQSEYAGAMLTLVHECMLSDPAYVQRLARHYRLFKAKDTATDVRAAIPFTPLPDPPKKLRVKKPKHPKPTISRGRRS